MWLGPSYVLLRRQGRNAVAHGVLLAAAVALLAYGAFAVPTWLTGLGGR